MSQNVENHMVKAILVTLFCCLPLGIVAIIKASAVNSQLAAGDVEGAQASAAEANKWANYGLVGFVVLSILYIILMVLGIAVI